MPLKDAGINNSIAGVTALMANANMNIKTDISAVSSEIKEGTQNIISSGNANYANLINNVSHLAVESQKNFGHVANEIANAKFFSAEAERRTQLLIMEKSAHSDLRNADAERRQGEKTYALENEMLKQFKYTDLQACHNTSSILQKLAECCCENKGLHKDNQINALQQQINNIIIAGNNNGGSR